MRALVATFSMAFIPQPSFRVHTHEPTTTESEQVQAPRRR